VLLAGVDDCLIKPVLSAHFADRLQRLDSKRTSLQTVSC
jgi:hypothetical protein